MIRAIVTDIEGTTSALSFVKDVLFPYARERLADFVQAHIKEPAVAALLANAHAATDRDDLDVEGLIALMRTWIDRDLKLTPLKALQGLIWEDGYRRGDFTGHVYADAVERLRDWHARGIALYIFSSGSIHAQRLLFGHTEYGDLTPLFSGYFDTTTGPKRESESYRAIARAIGLPPAEILFLSDTPEELAAAATAGMAVVRLVRDGEPAPTAVYREVRDFNAI